MSDQLIFEPWFGKNYGASSYGRLLIIGESHYTGDEEYTESTDFTSKVVDDYLNKKNDIRFFRNLGLLFNEQDRYEIWGKVSFANAIQNGLSDAKSQPQTKDIDTIIPAFWHLLEKTTPERVIICSNRMWTRWMPNSDKRSSPNGHLDENGKHSTTWNYNYSCGNCSAIGINHPSSIGFSYSSWRPLVFKFLNS
jgi:hypothetical protein